MIAGRYAVPARPTSCTSRASPDGVPCSGKMMSKMIDDAPAFDRTLTSRAKSFRSPAFMPRSSTMESVRSTWAIDGRIFSGPFSAKRSLKNASSSLLSQSEPADEDSRTSIHARTREAATMRAGGRASLRARAPVGVDCFIAPRLDRGYAGLLHAVNESAVVLLDAARACAMLPHHDPGADIACRRDRMFSVRWRCRLPRCSPTRSALR